MEVPGISNAALSYCHFAGASSESLACRCIQFVDM